MCQVARGASIFLFYPLLSSGRVGYPMTWKTALFMVWAGLRGAVSNKLGSFQTHGLCTHTVSPPTTTLLLCSGSIPLPVFVQVGVAMSLFVLLDPLIASDEFKAHCVFYMAIMAFGTVIINGTTGGCDRPGAIPT